MKQDCPVCNSTDTRKDYETPESMRACNICGSEWNCCDDITLDARLYYTDEENNALGRNKLDILK